MKHHPDQPDARLCSASPRGFTLVEMTVSLAVLSILLIAIGSAIMLAAKTLPQESDTSRETTWAAMIVEDMASDLQYALSFTERTATSVEFTVADRDGDGARETIRYSWSGIDGDPLERVYNGGEAEDLVEEPHEFELLYDTTVRTRSIPTSVQSAEVELARFATGSIPQTHITTSTNWIGQYFLPASLPGDTTSWTVTRAMVRARSQGIVDGVTSVQLCLADAGDLPTKTVVDEALLPENTLGGTFAWEPVVFTNDIGMPPDEGLCLVLAWTSGAEASAIEYDTAGGTGLAQSGDAGTSWAGLVPGSLLYYVYGTYLRPGTPISVDDTYLTGIRIKLRAGEETATLVQTSTPLLHVKEITP